MKIPKIKELAHWVICGGYKTFSKNKPLTKYADVEYEESFVEEAKAIVYTAKFSLTCRFIQQYGEDIKENSFFNLPEALQKALMQEVYGEVIEELNYLIPEARNADILCGSDIASKLLEIKEALC